MDQLETAIRELQQVAFLLESLLEKVDKMAEIGQTIQRTSFPSNDELQAEINSIGN
jgi:hypothetical protein